MKTKFSMFAMVALCTVSAVAQNTQPARRESVMKFFTVMHIEQQVQQVQNLMMTEVAKSMRSTLENDPSLTRDDKEKVMDLIEPEMQDAAKVYPVSEMLDDMLPVYQKHFTDSDMQAITAFFESPVGKKFIDENGSMMQEAMAVIMPKMNTRMQARMNEMQQRIIDRLKQKETEKKD